jgi:hypothetical protein
MDSKALAQRCGVTVKTINQRARILGISGTQAKIEGKEGRPATVYNPEECDRIGSYGKAQTPVSDSDLGNDDEAIDRGVLALQTAIGNPLSQQFGAIATQLETIEDLAANALVQRVQALPNRVMLKAAQRLQSHEGLDLTAIIGVLGCQALSLPARKIDPSLI